MDAATAVENLFIAEPSPVEDARLRFGCQHWRSAMACSIVEFIGPMTAKHRIFTTPVANVYPYYIAKAERKGRTKAEVDTIFCWLTGYTPKQFEKQLKQLTDFETFFAKAPKMNPARKLITGVICGIRVEDIEEPTMREIRYLDKLVDELAKGKAMEKILRS